MTKQLLIFKTITYFKSWDKKFFFIFSIVCTIQHICSTKDYTRNTKRHDLIHLPRSV